jgi:hypothetical protein
MDDRKGAPTPTVSIESEYLGTLDIELDPSQPVGPRFIVNVRSGTLRGPKINATIVPPAGDWLVPMPDGSLRIDVRASLKTDDGDFILYEANGVIERTPEVAERLARGERITSNESYFIATPRFSTTSQKYGWLNRLQMVAKLVSIERPPAQQGKLIYEVFIVR